MELTVLDEREAAVDATVDGDHLWIATADLEATTGWSRRPEGLCRGSVCVPVRDPIDGANDTVDLAAVATALGKRSVFDPAGPVVALADDPMGRGEVRNLHDLSLPDLDGRMVDLADLAGSKVVLHAWASW